MNPEHSTSTPTGPSGPTGQAASDSTRKTSDTQTQGRAEALYDRLKVFERDFLSLDKKRAKKPWKQRASKLPPQKSFQRSKASNSNSACAQILSKPRVIFANLAPAPKHGYTHPIWGQALCRPLHGRLPRLAQR